MVDEKLLAKIRKLFAMAEMGTKNEAEVAMQKAHELMKAHGVTKDEVKLFTTDVNAPVRKAKWVTMLAQLCAEFSGVVSYFSRRYFCFAGDEIGANVAKELFIYLKKEIERQLEKENIKGQRGKNSFRIGCVISLFEKMEKFGGWRDMQERRKRVQEKYFSKMKIKQDRKVGVDRNYFNSGKQSGADININRQTGVNHRAGFIQ
jgi:hypothetical protein